MAITLKKGTKGDNLASYMGVNLIITLTMGDNLTITLNRGTT